MESLYLEGRITLTDLHSVYEALFLRALTGFEDFIEKLFFSILNGRTKHSKKRVSIRITPSSNSALYEIVYQNDKYLKWIPFENTENRARLYLNGGRPFSELDDAGRSTIRTVTTIRNAIAHKSPHALNEFKRKVIGAAVLLPGEKRPAGYLRSRANPIQNRFEIYIIELARIASDLS
jgi:hypothetical protein